MAMQSSVRGQGAQEHNIDEFVEKAGFTSVEDAPAIQNETHIFASARLDRNLLKPAPIRPEWILEGAPEAKAVNLTEATRGWATTDHWSCTKGKFHWHYEWDESVLFLEGSVTITDDLGNVYHGRPGVSLFFPAGTSATWEVNHYIRKLAFNLRPVSSPLNFLSKVERKMRRVLGLKVIP